MRTAAAFLYVSEFCFAAGCSGSASSPQADAPAGTTSSRQPQVQDANDKQVDDILNKLSEKTRQIRTYQCAIKHVSRQPLFDSQTLRTGRMWYLREKNKSLLRVDFDTLKQDEQPKGKYVEQFFFDGEWLTRVDYQLKEVKKYQLVDVNELKDNKSADAFDLISEHLPIVGFTGIDKLKKQFDITLAEPNSGEPNDWVGLHMKVKPDSIYKDDWVWVNFWIDQKAYLPAKVVTQSTQDDIVEISFIDPVVNGALAVSVFNVVIPKGFVESEVVPLKKDD
jgi:outer membrane lipoprotein-sorting protein